MCKIYILPRAKKDLDKIEKKFFNQIKERIILLTSNPRPSQCLKLTAEEGYCLGIGDWRILYRIDDKEKIIYIYRVKHRREAYR
ncbi:MAG: type II toxin-antitoxin system RelE/ParE family toxin [Candidatus Omnitrophica bacterium]|nr:type II toxin-antitoxin system RelE/ParE family toxin [Candidatus Omnitrophota bacterium]